MKVLFLDGTIIGNKTGAVLEMVRSYIEETGCGYELEILKLADYTHQFVDGRPASDYNDDMKKLVHKFNEADGYIVATPVFQGSIPGVLKNVFDMLHPHTMRYKPVSIVANGGTYQHHLVIENQLKPILDYFRCLVTPNYVYTHRSHFDRDNNIIDNDVHDRLRELARVFVKYAEMSKRLSKDALDDD
ncbi:NADPH-dependent FMN reductase [Filibacter tadaridae]|uniref:NAD(P)H-dependent FAD/FMN reductase n=1 Tax=Filibacter tadaridae TaxID=2483811 RepID=A0A3P5WDS1_9BACL|nr:NADPH-dependent FMN reductase [Filibacter tadaridae]VDC19344.1 NAD(P)H-dependent FAD/FMN reductase [Filibacter tadaridae]